MAKPPHRPRLRERVEARKRGVSRDGETATERGRTRTLRLVGYVLQAVGLIWLFLYVILLFETGFAGVDWVMVVFPSAIFVIGRALHFWVAYERRRRLRQ